MRQTKDVIVDGKVIETETKEGSFYRSSDGSTLRQWMKADGTLDWGDLNDNKDLMSYKLTYISRLAQGDRAPEGAQPNRPDDLLYLASKGLPEDSVEGIRCVVSPIKVAMPGDAPRTIGRTCRSIEYNLELRNDVTTQPVTNKTFHAVFELHHIQMGLEPDPELFDVHRNFTVYVPEPPKK